MPRLLLSGESGVDHGEDGVAGARLALELKLGGEVVLAPRIVESAGRDAALMSVPIPVRFDEGRVMGVTTAACGAAMSWDEERAAIMGAWMGRNSRY